MRMLLVAAALCRDQGSGSAVRLGNDNIEHARPPLGRVALRRAFPRARLAVGATATRIDLPRAWCARSVSSFCVALFCKTSGNTRTVQSQKKKRRAAERVATFHERNGRVYWMLDVRPWNEGEGNRTVRRRFLLTPRWAGRGFAARGRLDDSATNRRACSHCLHASDWIVIFEGVGRRRRRRRRRALGVQRRERGTLGALRA